MFKTCPWKECRDFAGDWNKWVDKLKQEQDRQKLVSRNEPPRSAFWPWDPEFFHLALQSLRAKLHFSKVSEGMLTRLLSVEPGFPEVQRDWLKLAQGQNFKHTVRALPHLDRDRSTPRAGARLKLSLHLWGMSGTLRLHPNSPPDREHAGCAG